MFIIGLLSEVTVNAGFHRVVSLASFQMAEMIKPLPHFSMLTNSTNSTSSAGLNLTSRASNALPASAIQNATLQTLFLESGLPANATWDVAYGGLTEGSGSNSIVFSTPPGNYSFSIQGPAVNGSVYLPIPSTGMFEAGNILSVRFASQLTVTSPVRQIPKAGNLSALQVQNLTPSGREFNGTFISTSRHLRLKFSGSAIKSIDVMLTSPGLNLSITVQNQTATPGGLPPAPSAVYQSIQINGISVANESTTNIDNYIINVTYNFSVPDSWLSQQKASSNAVRLFKYYNSTWNQLPTTIIGANSTYTLYSAVSNSFSNYAVGYLQANGVSTSASQTLPMTNAFTTNFFAIASYEHSTTLPTTANIVIDSSNSLKGSHTNSNETYIAHNTLGYPTISGLTSTDGSAIIGLGANVIYTSNGINGNFYTTNGAVTNPTTTESLTYNVISAGSFAIILESYAGNSLTSIATSASGCTSPILAKGVEDGVGLITCNSIAAGSYTANMIFVQPRSGTEGSFSIGAYVFPPYPLTLKTTNAEGTITTNGIVYSGTPSNVINVIGTNGIVATPNTGYAFQSWSGASSNILISNPAARSTFATVEGAGTLTANFANTLTSSWAVSNQVLDFNQFQKLTAIAVGDTDPSNSYTYNFLVYNALGSLVDNALYTGVSSTSDTFTFQQSPAWLSGQFTANIIITDVNSNPAQSVSNTITYGGNILLSAGAITPSAPNIDSGQGITLTSAASGGTQSYTINWFSQASCTGSSQGTGTTFTSSPPSSTTYSYNVIDSASTPNTICSGADTVTVNSQLSPTISPSPTFPATLGPGNTIVFTATTGGGSPSYTYNYIITSTTGAPFMLSYLVSNTFSSNAFSWTIPPADAGNTVFANVIITDSAQGNSGAQTANSPETDVLTIPASTPTCTISLSNSLISFGAAAGVPSGSSSGISNTVLDTNNGNSNAWLWVEGGNWIGPQTADNGNFYVTNTLWSATLNGAGTQLQLPTGANTEIFLPTSGSNSIYFGVNVPVGATGGTFAQTITLINTC